MHYKKKKVFISIFGLISLLLFSCDNIDNNNSTNKPVLKDEFKSIKIFAVNDTHGAYEYLPNLDRPEPGLSRLGNYLINEKAKDPDQTFIISSGDMWQGSADSNLNKGALVTEVMNIIGFDAMSIGNHEFDWGEEIIRKNKEIANFPFLACNLFYTKDFKRVDFTENSVVIEKDGFKLGIIGSIKEGVGNSIVGTVSKNYYFYNPIRYIKNESDRLYLEEDVDSVILSTHDDDYRIYETLASSYSDLTNNRYIDGLFYAHNHYVESGKFYNTPVSYIQGGDNGRYVSKMTLDFHLNKDLDKYELKSSKVENINISKLEDLSSNLEIDNLYNLKYKEDIDEVKNDVLTTLDYQVSEEIFADKIVEELLDLSKRIKDKFNYNISLACMNYGGVRDPLTKGELTYAKLMKSIPFDNEIVIMGVNKSLYNKLIRDSNLNNNNDYCYLSAFKDGEPIFDENGLTYVISVDFIAGKNQYTPSKIIETDIYLLETTYKAIKEKRIIF